MGNRNDPARGAPDTKRGSEKCRVLHNARLIIDHELPSSETAQKVSVRAECEDDRVRVSRSARRIACVCCVSTRCFQSYFPVQRGRLSASRYRPMENAVSNLVGRVCGLASRQMVLFLSDGTGSLVAYFAWEMGPRTAVTRRDCAGIQVQRWVHLSIVWADEGFMSFVCIAVYTWSSVRIHGIQSLTFLYDHFLGLTFAAFLWSVVLATGTYISSFRGEKTPLLAEGGNTGNWIYDVRVCGIGLMAVVHRASPQSQNPPSLPRASKTLV